MNSSTKVIVLGSGTSHGVPMIGCDCDVCTSDDPRDKRTRTSIYVEHSRARFLVDTAPELRLQCVTHGIRAVDAVLFTHHHADHVTGLDDLRRFNWLMKQTVWCYGAEPTLRGIRKMFPYAFEAGPDGPHSRPHLEMHAIDSEPFQIGEAAITPIPLMHGPMPVLGFRFGRFAYCTDCNHIAESSLAMLEGLDCLILGALRRTPHPAHFTLDEAISMAKQIGAKHTYFTHLTHQLGHQATNAELPKNIELCYDGLVIEC